MIDAKRIKFIEKEEKVFIRYELLQEERIAKIELEMLKNNKIEHILDISEIHEDRNIVFLYNVTSKIQLSRRLQEVFSGEQLYKMLQSLCSVWICVDEYMLDRKHFIFYPEVMYIHQETSELFVMVLPVYTEDDKEMELRMILIGMLARLPYYDEMLPNFYLRLQEYIQERYQFTTTEFKEFLEQAYKEERGILQPISEAPSAPEQRREEGKKIVHEEEAKAILQSRFQTVNHEEIKFLEDEIIANDENYSEVIENGISKGKAIHIPTPIKPDTKSAGKSNGKQKNGKVPVPIPAKKEEKKKRSIFVFGKEKKLKQEPEQKSVPVSVVIPQAGKQPYVPEKKEKQKEEKQKEGKPLKKGIFHVFGKKKEKEEPKLEENVVVVPQPVNGINDNRIPVDKSGKGVYTDPSQMTGYCEVRGAVNSNINSNVNLNQYAGFYGNDINRRQAQRNEIQQIPPWTLPIENIERGDIQTQPFSFHQSNQFSGKINLKKEEEKGIEIDLDSTTLMEKEIDLDATVLTNNFKPVNIPVLRSRETGEIVKITYSGFLVGRQKIRDGKIIIKDGEKQPDLILAINNVSHSHALFIEKMGEWYIQDQNSLNGTFINEERLLSGQERILQEGDRLRFASEEYEYLIIRE